MLNIHIDNPDLRDVSFEAGVTFYYTEELREIEAGFFQILHNYLPSLVVPPETQDWTIVGHCSSACTQASFDPEGINIFAVAMHAHTSGRLSCFEHFNS